MLLAVVDPRTGVETLAMLLDEPPSRLYLPGSLGGDPWRRGGPLATAAADAARYARAWLTIVYKGDDVRTWGAQRVKVVAGGDIYAPLRARPGELVRLQYKSVCRELFGLRGEGESAIAYRAVTRAELGAGGADDEDADWQHPWLGYKDAPSRRPRSELEYPARADAGCVVHYVERAAAGAGATTPGDCVVRNEKDFERWRFELTEYQRRPFVNAVLERLGYIAPSRCTMGVAPYVTMQMNYRGLVLAAAESMQALANLLAAGVARHGMSATADAAPPPDVPGTKVLLAGGDPGSTVRAARNANGSYEEEELLEAGSGDGLDEKMAD